MRVNRAPERVNRAPAGLAERVHFDAHVRVISTGISLNRVTMYYRSLVCVNRAQCHCWPLLADLPRLATLSVSIELHCHCWPRLADLPLLATLSVSIELHCHGWPLLVIQWITIFYHLNKFEYPPPLDPVDHYLIDLNLFLNYTSRY